MKKPVINWACLSLLIFGAAVPSVAVQMKQITWDDLIPITVAFDDPFAEMERETLEYLGFVARVRGLIATGKPVSKETRQEAMEVETELIKEGIDVDGLLSRRNEIRELRKKRAGAVVDELDGASVKMPGYMLPLEFSGQKITEFLLVPWVGACIHTPPPPPNQIVHVVIEKGNAFESRSIYEPVWVAGQMSTRTSTKNLFLKDGSRDIHISYKIQAALVERYKKPYWLKALTSVNGKILKLSGEVRDPYPEGKIGVIEKGAYADLLLGDGNPLEDITVIGGNEQWFDAEPRPFGKGHDAMRIIMKDGKIYKNTL